jgi:two-component system sensor histidine kinase KdpD
MLWVKGLIRWNVLQNACKYAPPAAPITITAAQREGALLLCVADRGPGIPPAERTRVFDKFYRLPHPDQRPIAGAGIGLAICKGLVEAHGGQITIGGRDGGGTIVTIRLPLDLAERASAQGA